jgi:two-component system response regulator DctR
MVYIVDDDASVRDALAWLLRSRHLPSEVFASGEAFDQLPGRRLCAHEPCCLLLDVRMPGMSGWRCLSALIARGLAASLPVIFLTGHADVPTAVDAVKRGAFDFCEKAVFRQRAGGPHRAGHCASAAVAGRSASKATRLQAGWPS